MSNDTNIPKKYKGKNIWSYSKLTSYYDCPKAYWLQRIMKVENKNNIWGCLGQIVHNTLEGLIKNEITKEQAISKFEIELEEARLGGVNFPTPSMEENYKKSIKHYLERFVKPDVKDFKIELKSFLELEGNNVLIGFIDFVILHHDDSIEIRDFKTSSKFTGTDLDDKARQLLIYSEMLKQNYKKVKQVKVSYDMLKYAVVTYKEQKRTKCVDRQKLVVMLKDKIEKDLLEIYAPVDADLKLIEAISKNEIPKEIESNYKIEPYIQYYEYDEEKIKGLYEWLYSTINTIQNAVEFPAKILSNPKDSEFFCTNLCGVRESCEEYKCYIDNKEKLIDSLLEDDSLF